MSGGSSPPPAPQPDPRAEAQAQIELEQARARIAAEQAAADRERQEREAAELAAARGQSIDVGTRSATDRINQDLMNLYGIADPSAQYGTQVSQYLGDIAAGVPTDARDASSFFTGDLTTQLVEDLVNRERGTATRGVDAFAAPGFARDLYADTADDPFIDAILADQFQGATDTLTRAFDRGTLDQTGFDAALANLGQQRTAANSRLQDLGGGILEGYREQARGTAQRGRDAIGALNLGQGFDVAQLQADLNTQAGSNLGRLEGDLRRSIGSEPLFDTADLIQRGSARQGLINPARGNAVSGTGGELLAAIRQRDERENTDRGLGTQGAF